ncbi:hypothetical protein [Flavobacterium zepuense]|uniref:hypothetical protein n=1 Tax=Flavobacterium zepuense TaxID=2593302 RepID=UPI00163DA51A|nr:hypothetical protein [Flavobacterium zepuense]
MKINTIHHQDIETAMELALQGAIDNRNCNITDDAALSIMNCSKLPETLWNRHLNHYRILGTFTLTAHWCAPWDFNLNQNSASDQGCRYALAINYFQ